MPMLTLLPGVFRRNDPAADPAPVLVDVSRSGREYPPEFRSPLPFSEVHDNVSMYVEDFCAAAPEFGATLLYACFPNTFIDTNRSAADVDESLIEGKWPGPITQSDFTQRGLGLIKRLSRYGTQMQERKLTVAELQERLATYHEPYHQELARILAGMRARVGQGDPAELPLHVGDRRADSRRPGPAARRLQHRRHPRHDLHARAVRLHRQHLARPGPLGQPQLSLLRRGADAAPFEPREPLRERVHRDQQAAVHRHQDVQEDRGLRRRSRRRSRH